MKNSSIKTSSFILGSLILASCSTNKLATTDGNDNLYFMASDAKIATEYAVQNNNPEQFHTLSSVEDAVPQESFSSRNVNPDYIARYQAEERSTDSEVVYFDESEATESNPDIDAYNNYRVGNSGINSNFSSSMAFNMGMMYGMSPWGLGAFYNPYMGFGFRPGFNLNFSLGFGNPFFSPMYRYGGFGYGGFYDPFMPMYGMGRYGFGSPFYGYSPMFPSNPIYILPGGEYGDRRVVRGVRPTRGSSLAASSRTTNLRNSALQPSTARAQARRDVLDNNSSSTRRSISNSNNSRASARDFSSSQNDYYNSRSRTSSARNINSAAMDRPVSRSRSAMPSARPSINPSNSRSNNTGRAGSVRSYPTNTRSSSPSYNRSNVPARTSSPSYNRNTNTRTITPSRSSVPSSTFNTPSRSSGSSSGSTGGVTRSSSSTSRGRGN